MKKFVVLLVVVAMTCISGMAFAAAEVSVSGEIAVRSRDFTDLDMVKGGAGSTRDTQEKVRLDVNAKAGDVKGKISLWNDFNEWGGNSGGFENAFGAGFGSAKSGTENTTTVGEFGFREAWINFNLPGIPVNVTAGHQLLSLGNGWFFRSMHYGSDAWVAANVTGNNTAAIVNVKVAEGNPGLSDDADAYVLLDVFKIDDNNTVGVDITDLKNRTAKAAGTNVDLQNIGVNYNGKLGIVALKAELDVQMGKQTHVGGKDNKYAGNELVIQGNLPLDPVTVNFTVARGSGQDPKKPYVAGNGNDIGVFTNFLDVDPHYTFLYEYKIAGPAGVHTGFANTTALGVGADFKAMDTLTLGASIWMLQSTEKVANVVSGTGTTTDLGQEIDLKVNWKLADNLSWNWNLGMFNPGDGMGKDSATGVQGILSMTF